MTKKDYAAFANMLGVLRTVSYAVDDTLRVVQSEMCFIFERDNPRFNRMRFYKYIDDIEKETKEMKDDIPL